MKRIYHCFVGGAVVALGALTAVLMVSGGWEAVAAAVGILAGLVSVLSFVVLGVARERPGLRRRAAAPSAA